MSPRIYLDHAATTPVLPVALQAMIEGTERWANPSSPHAEGRAARRALENARDRVRHALDWEGDVIFTASVTEAAGLAFAKAKAEGGRIAVSATEHDALLRQAGPHAQTIDVKQDGVCDVRSLDDWLTNEWGGLLAVQHVNSETGVLQPLDEIAEETRDAGVTLLVDCAQSAGKMPLPPADMILIGGHKFGGPPGIAALLVRDLRLLVPAGRQERGYRGGTENVPAILGMVAALEERKESQRSRLKDMANLRNRLEDRLRANGALVIAQDAVRSPMIGAYAMPGMSAQAQVVRLDGMGFAVSAGSACSSGSMKPSHVLEAMDVEPAVAKCTIRVSFSFETKEPDVDAFARAWIDLAQDAARRAA